MFTPVELECTIAGSLLNPVSEELGYDVVVPIRIAGAENSTLTAELVNSATCAPTTDDRFSVSFTGGILRQTAGGREAWEATFGETPVKTIKSRLVDLVLGLKHSRADGTMRYTMKRSPEGYLDVCYLDDDFRITKGNKGSLVIAERQHVHQPGPTE